METYIATFMCYAPNCVDIRYDISPVLFQGDNIKDVYRLVKIYEVTHRVMLCTLTKQDNPTD